MTDTLIAASIHPSGLAQRSQPITSSPDAPVICCRECGQTMEAKPWRELQDAAVTCRNQACGLRSQTFSASVYAHVDLSRYKRGKRR